MRILGLRWQFFTEDSRSGVERSRISIRVGHLPMSTWRSQGLEPLRPLSGHPAPSKRPSPRAFR